MDAEHRPDRPCCASCAHARMLQIDSCACRRYPESRVGLLAHDICGEFRDVYGREWNGIVREPRFVSLDYVITVDDPRNDAGERS